VFTENGYVVVGLDHFGHGRSDGIHAYFDSIDTWVEDARHQIHLLKKRQEFEKLPFFLMGQSLGGAASILYSVKCKKASWFQRFVL
jgi:alpha-beta hydrolase superfamily lysophospholipase